MGHHLENNFLEVEWSLVEYYSSVITRIYNLCVRICYFTIKKIVGDLHDWLTAAHSNYCSEYVNVVSVLKKCTCNLICKIIYLVLTTNNLNN